MCYYVGIEDLVAGALVELLRRRGQRSVSFEALERYGNAVVKHIRSSHKDVILVLSREQTQGFIRNCSDLFDVESPELSSGIITLKSGHTVEDLVRRFGARIPAVVLKAMIDDVVVNELLNKAA